MELRPEAVQSFSVGPAGSMYSMHVDPPHLFLHQVPVFVTEVPEVCRRCDRRRPGCWHQWCRQGATRMEEAVVASANQPSPPARGPAVNIHRRRLFFNPVYHDLLVLVRVSCCSPFRHVHYQGICCIDVGDSNPWDIDRPCLRICLSDRHGTARSRGCS